MFKGLFRQDTEETIENCMIAEYIWIDGTGEGLRSKSRTLNI